jgi:hypothetical protein
MRRETMGYTITKEEFEDKGFTRFTFTFHDQINENDRIEEFLKLLKFLEVRVQAIIDCNRSNTLQFAEPEDAYVFNVNYVEHVCTPRQARTSTKYYCSINSSLHSLNYPNEKKEEVDKFDDIIDYGALYDIDKNMTVIVNILNEVLDPSDLAGLHDTQPKLYAALKGIRQVAELVGTDSNL